MTTFSPKMTIWVVDAFTAEPFKGNPAAVAVVSDFPDEAYMQAVAGEMNLSETCFVKKESSGQYYIRWFTPTTEVTLCGHATLAAAYVLGWCLGENRSELQFHSKSGVLVTRQNNDRIALDFPIQEIQSIPKDVAIEKSLGGSGVAEAAEAKVQDGFLIYAYSDPDTVMALQPDFEALKQATPRAVIVTAPGKPPMDYIVRVFAPQYGINEDPVTGSAQCSLAVFWEKKLNRSQFNVRQESRRSGRMYVAIKGKRVHISGDAVLISKQTCFVGSKDLTPKNSMN